MTLWG